MKYVTLIFLILSCLSCGDKKGNEKGLYIKNADWDFGSTNANIEMEHTFVLENPTEQKCIITKIIASCGCTNYKLEKDTLQPKDRCNLKVVLTTPSVSGNFMRDISIYSTISEEPNIITLNGYIPVSKKYVKNNFRVKLQEGIYAKTNVVYMGNLYKDKQLNKDIELVNVTNKRIPITLSISPSLKWTEIVGPKQLEPWKPELFKLICDGSLVDKDWGEKTFEIIFGNNRIKCVVNLIPMCFVNRKNNKARVYIASSNNEKIEIRNVGIEELNILKVKTIKNSGFVIKDSTIHAQNNGFINIKNRVINDTIEILTNDTQNPLVRIPLN